MKVLTLSKSTTHQSSLGDLKGKSSETLLGLSASSLAQAVGFSKRLIQEWQHWGMKLAPLVSRQERTLIWLLRMLFDFARSGQFNPSNIIETSSFNIRNDKAFACNGSVTNKYMKSPQLTKPRFKKEIVRDIILNGGQKFLSPERRLDAILVSSPDLFSDAGDAAIPNFTVEDTESEAEE